MKPIWLRLGTVALIVSVAAALSHVTGLSIWPMLGLAAFGVVANGVFATIEDDLPGGFNNPDGTTTPRYVSKMVLAIRGITLLPHNALADARGIRDALVAA